jgi:hypothetical protein
MLSNGFQFWLSVSVFPLEIAHATLNTQVPIQFHYRELQL